MRKIKSPLKCKDCFRQDPLLNAKIRGRNFNKKEDFCVASKYLPKII